MKSLLSTLALLTAVGCAGAPAPKPVPPKAVAAPKVPAAPPVDPQAWRNERPKSGAPAAIEYPAVAVDHLPNGLTVYVVKKPAGVVSMSLIARGGASTVPAGKSGLSAFTARLMTEGTKKKSALELAEASESVGTAIEQSASRDSIRIGMTSLEEDMKPALSLLAEVIREPSFPQKEIDRVRGEWLDSLDAERQSPSRLASLVGLRLLLGSTVGAPVDGSRKDVEHLTRKDLVKFYRQNFVPGNMALVVVGDVTMADVRPLALELFGSLRGAPPKATEPTLPDVSLDAKKVFVVERPGAVQSALFVAQRFPKRSEPGHESRKLLNDLVGGFFTSRLNLNLREDHAYTYGVHSLDIATRGWGAFVVMSQVRTDVTGPALVEALGEIRKAKDPSLGKPISDGEVELARVDLKQELGASLVDVDAIGGRVERLFVDDLPDDYLNKYPGLLDSATPTTLAVVAQALDPNRMVIVIVGDKSAISEQVTAKGFTLEPVDPTLTQ